MPPRQLISNNWRKEKKEKRRGGWIVSEEERGRWCESGNNMSRRGHMCINVEWCFKCT